MRGCWATAGRGRGSREPCWATGREPRLGPAGEDLLQLSSLIKGSCAGPGPGPGTLNWAPLLTFSRLPPLATSTSGWLGAGAVLGLRAD